MAPLQIITTVMINYLIAWIPMLVIAILNGALREFVLKRYSSDNSAHRISTISLLILFGFYIWGVMAMFPPVSGQQAAIVGGLWFTLTLAFEFGFGRFTGKSWAMLLSEYNVRQGKLWILVPVWVAISPYLFYKLHYLDK